MGSFQYHGIAKRLVAQIIDLVILSLLLLTIITTTQTSQGFMTSVSAATTTITLTLNPPNPAVNEEVKFEGTITPSLGSSQQVTITFSQGSGCTAAGTEAENTESITHTDSTGGSYSHSVKLGVATLSRVGPGPHSAKAHIANPSASSNCVNFIVAAQSQTSLTSIQTQMQTSGPPTGDLMGLQNLMMMGPILRPILEDVVLLALLVILALAFVALRQRKPCGPTQTSSMKYQGILSRMAAQIVDSVFLLAIVILLVGTVMLLAGIANPYTFLLALGLIPLPLLYAVILEGLTGATLGKKLLGIKVVRENGEACGFGPALIRNVLRIIDSLPFLYIIGMILIAKSDKKQRVGDRVAKTVVVKAQPPGKPMVSEIAAMFCMECGAKIEPDNEICKKCGTKITG